MCRFLNGVWLLKKNTYLYRYQQTDWLPLVIVSEEFNKDLLIICIDN